MGVGSGEFVNVVEIGVSNSQFSHLSSPVTRLLPNRLDRDDVPSRPNIHRAYKGVGVGLTEVGMHPRGDWRVNSKMSLYLNIPKVVRTWVPTVTFDVPVTGVRVRRLVPLSV